MPEKISDADRLRTRGKRMLELATRADCEKNYDFARLLTQLAIEVFAHARELEENRERAAVNRFARQSGGYIGFDRDRTAIPVQEMGNKF
ncbi:MAG: hypothetical protein WAK67_13920 [Xanthobacteraceae bacterium]|jgi:hypothetical protein